MGKHRRQTSKADGKWGRRKTSRPYSREEREARKKLRPSHKKGDEQSRQVVDDRNKQPRNDKTTSPNPGSKRQSNGNKNSGVPNEERRGPSQDALDLSRRLKELGFQKRLSDVLKLYWDESNNPIRDCHHACIVVDCAARCGDIDEGEKAVFALEKAGAGVSVECKTALLKGYSLSDRMAQGHELFVSMVEPNRQQQQQEQLGQQTKKKSNRRQRPNVRTLNTLLRGCLWNAAVPVPHSSDNNNNGNKGSPSQSSLSFFTGGIVTSDYAWSKCGKLADASSYEYYIAQLCSALRTSDAEKMLDTMKASAVHDGNENANGLSFLESVAMSTMAIARAHALLLGRHATTERFCKEAMDVAERCKVMRANLKQGTDDGNDGDDLEQSEQLDADGQPERKRRKTKGGEFEQR